MEGCRSCLFFFATWTTSRFGIFLPVTSQSFAQPPHYWTARSSAVKRWSCMNPFSAWQNVMTWRNGSMQGARCLPTKLVAGDFYDFFFVDQRKLAVVMVASSPVVEVCQR